MTTDGLPLKSGGMGTIAESIPTRRRWPKYTLIALLLIAVAIGLFTLRLLWRAGSFRTITPHFAGRCRLIDGPVGPEDLTIDAGANRAYVSASDRRAAATGRPVPGAMWAYALDAPDTDETRLVNLTPDATTYFQPHGISLWVGEDGRRALFVVNHPAPGNGWPAHTIEIYDIGDAGLVHRATLTDPRLIMPNDVVAVGLDRFYVTNTHAHAPGWAQTIETYLQLREAQVLSYGPGGFRTAATDLLFPNGINVSRDGQTVYIASVTGLSVLVFDRDPRTDALTARGEIPVGSGPDNIEIDADGALWVGSHPKLLAVQRHAADASARAPGQVIRIRPGRDDASAQVEEVYLSDGTPIGAISAAARRGDRLLMGQIFGRGFLDCVMDQEGGQPAQ